MKEFETMTEKYVLYAAWYHILELAQKEEERLKENPEDAISRYHYERRMAMCNELNARIIEIEKDEN